MTMRIRQMIAAGCIAVAALGPSAMTAQAAPQVVASADVAATPQEALTGEAFDARWAAITAASIKDVSLCGAEITRREPNVVVSIGAIDDGIQREYFGVTNSTGQLVEVIAREIILQDDDTETVTADGRYCEQMPDVPGAGNGYDRGHVIADSLGGESNLYNLTPQQSTLNRHGDQAFIEDQIRKAGGAQDFHAIITYPDANADIPLQYSIASSIAGNATVHTFANADPESPAITETVAPQPGGGAYDASPGTVTNTGERVRDTAAPQTAVAVVDVTTSATATPSDTAAIDEQADKQEPLAVTGSGLQWTIALLLVGLATCGVIWARSAHVSKLRDIG